MPKVKSSRAGSPLPAPQDCSPWCDWLVMPLRDGRTVKGRRSSGPSQTQEGTSSSGGESGPCAVPMQGTVLDAGTVDCEHA